MLCACRSSPLDQTSGACGRCAAERCSLPQSGCSSLQTVCSTGQRIWEAKSEGSGSDSERKARQRKRRKRQVWKINEVQWKWRIRNAKDGKGKGSTAWHGKARQGKAMEGKQEGKEMEKGKSVALLTGLSQRSTVYFTNGRCDCRLSSQPCLIDDWRLSELIKQVESGAAPAGLQQKPAFSLAICGIDRKTLRQSTEQSNSKAPPWTFFLSSLP